MRPSSRRNRRFFYFQASLALGGIHRYLWSPEDSILVEALGYIFYRGHQTIIPFRGIKPVFSMMSCPITVSLFAGDIELPLFHDEDLGQGIHSDLWLHDELVEDDPVDGSFQHDPMSSS